MHNIKKLRLLELMETINRIRADCNRWSESLVRRLSIIILSYYYYVKGKLDNSQKRKGYFKFLQYEALFSDKRHASDSSTDPLWRDKGGITSAKLSPLVPGCYYSYNKTL